MSNQEISNKIGFPKIQSVEDIIITSEDISNMNSIVENYDKAIQEYNENFCNFPGDNPNFFITPAEDATKLLTSTPKASTSTFYTTRSKKDINSHLSSICPECMPRIDFPYLIPKESPQSQIRTPLGPLTQQSSSSMEYDENILPCGCLVSASICSPRLISGSPSISMMMTNSSTSTSLDSQSWNTMFGAEIDIPFSRIKNIIENLSNLCDQNGMNDFGISKFSKIKRHHSPDVSNDFTSPLKRFKTKTNDPNQQYFSDDKSSSEQDSMDEFDNEDSEVKLENLNSEISIMEQKMMEFRTFAKIVKIDRRKQIRNKLASRLSRLKRQKKVATLHSKLNESYDEIASLKQKIAKYESSLDETQSEEPDKRKSFASTNEPSPCVFSHIYHQIQNISLHVHEIREKMEKMRNYLVQSIRL